MLQIINLIILQIGTATNVAATKGIETSNSKMGTVILVLCLIFAGIAAYLFYTERKLTKLEKEIEGEE